MNKLGIWDPAAHIKAVQGVGDVYLVQFHRLPLENCLYLYDTQKI
jgi:hypothetical protein